MARDSVVALVVSAGPEPIVVPDVTGQSGTSASATLEAAGFTVSGIEGSPSGTVLATDPPAGSRDPRRLGEDLHPGRVTPCGTVSTEGHCPRVLPEGPRCGRVAHLA
ncbi:MAG: PASTA domain-containing protein [Microthrixaceae bacterium]|nr:PASTA domain-containing protein [Microthrixaceae bacterium]